jgi:hypothetical protein
MAVSRMTLDMMYDDKYMYENNHIYNNAAFSSHQSPPAALLVSATGDRLSSSLASLCILLSNNKTNEIQLPTSSSLQLTI